MKETLSGHAESGDCSCECSGCGFVSVASQYMTVRQNAWNLLQREPGLECGVEVRAGALGWLMVAKDWDMCRSRSHESAIAKVKQELKGERNVGMIARTTPLRSKIRPI